MGQVRQPGNNTPGIEGVQEEVTGTVNISGSATSGTVTLSLDGAYDAAPEVAGLSASRENPTAGDASSYVDGHDVDRTNATQNSIDVTVHLDAAPGTGESVDVTVAAWISGDAKR